MSKAQGQFTIIDYNDALTLTGYIGSNLAKTQMYNPDNGSYTPDWKTKNLVLTPSLYVIGTTADQIATANVTSVKWYVGDSNTAITAGTNYALSGAKSHILTVKANVMAELPGIDYRCVITYKDESTGLSLTHPLTISFSRVVNGSGIVDLLVTTPNGNVFKNEEVASLTAKAELWRGSTVDTTKVSYKWAVMDASVTATSSTGYDADFGIGWRKISDAADKYTGTATNTLTVYAAAVDSYAVFKCCAQDTDSASASYNTKFFDVATFIDNSDPLQIIVTSTGGDVFKNGQGTTVLTAVCYQAGSEVDAAGNGSYTWTKYNKDGVVDTSWGTNGSKTGKTLSVSSADVDTKAMLTILASYAQEESRSASENQKWRIKRNFEEGMPWNGAMLGYRLKDGRYEIVPKEAALVRRIYNEYLAGDGYQAVAKRLTEEGVPSRFGGKWNQSVVSKILSNYTYTGNLLLQKTFRENHITKKTVINHGELPKYHAENTHEAIIDMKTFHAVQTEKARRAAQFNKKPAPRTTYPFTSLLVCDNCGKNYRRKTTKTGIVWVCGTFNTLGKSACASKQIPETTLQQVTAEVLGVKAFTREQLHSRIQSIRVCNGNILIFCFKDGSEVTRTWKDRSRSESWTDEMKEAARQKALERSKHNA